MRSIDTFAVANLAIFVCMALFVYRDPFTHAYGGVYLGESISYAALIGISGIALWHYFRRYLFPPWVLAAVQAGIFLHYAGAFAVTGGVRLYDIQFFGVSFDKFVHFANSFTAALVIDYFFTAVGVTVPRFRNFIILLVTLGLGGICEIVEYSASRVIPYNGVGGYDNTMEDLIANLFGGLVAASVRNGLVSARGGVGRRR